MLEINNRIRKHWFVIQKSSKMSIQIMIRPHALVLVGCNGLRLDCVDTVLSWWYYGSAISMWYFKFECR